MPREDLVEAIFFPSLKVQTAFIDLILRCDCGQNNTFHNFFFVHFVREGNPPVMLLRSHAFDKVCACQVSSGGHRCLARLATASWRRQSHATMRTLCVWAVHSDICPARMLTASN